MCSYGLFNNFQIFILFYVFYLFIYSVPGFKVSKMHLCQVKLTGNIMHSLKDNNVCLFVCLCIYLLQMAGNIQ